MPLDKEYRREYEAKRREADRKKINDVGEIPKPFDAERRKYYEQSPAEWMRFYMPERFSLEFSKSQLDYIERGYNAILHKAPQNINAYREFGKTSLNTGLAAFALFSGQLSNIIYITAEGTVGKNTYRAFDNLLFEPFPKDGKFAKHLSQDYPEICLPISIRDGVAQRPLEYHEWPCNITISPNEICLPQIYGSPTSGNSIHFASILSGKIRGTFHDIPGRGNLRPDAAIIDDVQNDGSAKSETEVENIMQIIKSSVDGVAGSDANGNKIPLTIFSALTQNQPGDVAERIIEELPDWATVIYRFLTSLPIDFEPWRKYRDFRKDTYLKYKENTNVHELARRDLIEYYTKHRSEIEYNCIADNPKKYEPWQVSAVHFALEKWCKSEKSFWCELQNDAARAKQESGGGLVPILVQRKKLPLIDQLMSRPYKRFVVPRDTQILTAFIDCGEHYLNYQVNAFGENYSFVHVVDFGVFPDQNFPTTSKKSFRRDLQTVYNNGDRFSRLRDAVTDCLEEIYSRQYFTADNEYFDIREKTGFIQNAKDGKNRHEFRKFSCCGVDCSDGEMELSLWEAIDIFHRRNPQYFGWAIPCYGDESSSRLMRYYDLKKGEWRRGKKNVSTCDWIENPFRSYNVKKRYNNIYASLLYDANTYKTARDAAWRTPLGTPGCESLCDWPEREYIEMFAQHQCAEEPVEDWKSNMRYLKWREKKPRVSDNEFLDTDTGCWALAHYVGIERETEKSSSRLKIKFS